MVDELRPVKSRPAYGFKAKVTPELGTIFQAHELKKKYIYIYKLNIVAQEQKKQQKKNGRKTIHGKRTDITPTWKHGLFVAELR